MGPIATMMATPAISSATPERRSRSMVRTGRPSRVGVVELSEVWPDRLQNEASRVVPRGTITKPSQAPATRPPMCAALSMFGTEKPMNRLMAIRTPICW